ncbi:hypothetical protein [Herbidospora cretacea]|uniref:hypothetical protein n=1 Tax=Herbidospora cretacea TaxID=28444 RepID=UPI0012DEFB24|nr:hypothetical protein [Herbidospora cretacea]
MVAGRVVSLVGAGILALSATPAMASEEPGRWMRTGDVWRFRLATVCGHAACSVPDGATDQGWRCPVQPGPAQPDQTMTGPGLFVEAPATMRLNLDTAELARRVAVVCARLSSLPPGKLSALAATGELADGVTQSAEQAAVAAAEARALAGQFAEEAARVTSQSQVNRPVYVAESQVASPTQAFEGQAQPHTLAAESMVTYPMQAAEEQAQPPVYVPADPSTRESAARPRTRQTEGRHRPRARGAEERHRSRARGEKHHRPRIREAEMQSRPEMHSRDEQGWPGGPDRQGPPEFRGGGEQGGPKGHQFAEPVAQPQAMPGIPMPEMPGNVNPGQSPLVDAAPGQQPNLPPAPQPGQEPQVAPGQMAVGEQTAPGGSMPQAAQGAPVELPQPMPNAAPAPAPGEMMPEPLSGGLSNLPPLPQLPPGPPPPPGMVEGGTPPELLMPMATPTPSGPPLTRSLNNTQAIAQEDSGLEIVKGWPGVVAAIAALIAVLALQMRLGRRKVVSDPQPK